MADWIKVIKPQVEAEISKARLTDKVTIKLILNLERRMNTCRNYLANGGTWSGMCELKANGDAYYMLEDLKSIHTSEWFKYLDANNYCRNAHVGDFLA
jgi:hypothetical protein